jgi:hypothetical protein
MKQSDFEKIKEKSKTKNDGVFSHNGIVYAVRGKECYALIDGNDVYQCSFGFLVNLGKAPSFVDKKKYIKEVFV